MIHYDENRFQNKTTFTFCKSTVLMLFVIMKERERERGGEGERKEGESGKIRVKGEESGREEDRGRKERGERERARRHPISQHRCLMKTAHCRNKILQLTPVHTPTDQLTPRGTSGQLQ